MKNLRCGFLRACAITLIACVSTSAARADFNVRDFGAKGDGTTLDSPSINKAIEKAAESGGGKVVLPEGRYFCGSIRMKSNIELHLAKGAVIVADEWNSTSYDPTEPFTPPAYQDGGHTYFHNSLIWGENLENVSITGEGLIDGTRLTTYKGELNKKLGFGKGSQGEKAEAPVDPDKPTYAANKAIAFKLCKKVTVSGISILKGGWFAVIVTGCDDVVLENLTIDTNRDGIDIDACVRVLVKNSRVNAPMDDAICPKSSYALGYARVTENVTIEGCEVSGFDVGSLLDGTRRPDPKDHRNGRIKFGTESSGGFRNCVVRDCKFIDSMGLALEVVDGGIAESIEASNLKMSNVKNYVLYIVTGKRNRTPNLTTVSTMKNVTISDVDADGVDAMSGIQIFGMGDRPIENLSLSKIRIRSKGGGTEADASLVPKDLGAQYPDPSGKPNMPAYGIFARNVQGLCLDNMDFSLSGTDMRPAARFELISGLFVDGFKGQTAEGVALAKIGRDVKEVQISNSPDLKKLFEGK
jgi:polygalacturonase